MPLSSPPPRSHVKAAAGDGWQLLRFGLVGGTTTLLYGAIVWGAMSLLNWSAAVSGAVAAVIAMAVNFTLQSRYTFRSAGRTSGSVPRYLIAQGIGAGLNGGALAVLVDGAGLPFSVGQGVGLFLYVAWSFLAQKLWVFAPPR